ncbi:MAG: TRAP transporter small permease [Spirochaetales bacterium]|jgi:TRAP-type C4-dicarboxylate transport system permease small subunit|nr:TRAP transporter small permease [Spirochaetales bacterium]
MKKFWDAYDRFLKGIILLTSSAFVILVLLQIFCRYVLGNSLAWSEEMCKLLFYATILFGSAVCITDYRHITIDILTLYLPRKIKRYWYLGVYVFMLCLCVYLIIYGYAFARGNMRQLTPAMQISFGYVYLVTPAASILMCVNTVRAAIYDVRTKYAPHEPGHMETEGGL